MSKSTKETRLPPVLKWAGGKETELKHIHPNMPKNINNYYEPFIGGGAVYFSVDVEKMFINDKSYELINVYKLVASEDKFFFDVIHEMTKNWGILERILKTNKEMFIHNYTYFSDGTYDEKSIKNNIDHFVSQHENEFKDMFCTFFNINSDNFIYEIKSNIFSKIKRMKKLESQRGKLNDNDILDNIESSLKSAFYMHFRHLYNNISKYTIKNSHATAIFFFIRTYAYSGMFRYNKRGAFNVPYGGIGYNKNDLSKKASYLQSPALIKHLSQTTIDNLDFEDFFKKNKPQADDFIFLDPPYDSEFNTYAKNKFSREDQVRLAQYLLESCQANWMLVMKYTDFVYTLYDKHNINIRMFNKKYLVSFQNRNDKDVQHLMITNYVLD